MLWTLWSKWMFCWLWKGEIGLAANHFTSHDYSYLTPKNLSSVFFISVIPEQFATSTMTIFIRRQAKGHWVFFLNFFINWFVCRFIFIFTLKCHSKFNYRSTEKKKWQMVRKLKETTRQNYYLSFLTKIRFVTRINLSVITREIMEKRRQTLNKTSGA